MLRIFLLISVFLISVTNLSFSQDTVYAVTKTTNDEGAPFLVGGLAGNGQYILYAIYEYNTPGGNIQIKARMNTDNGAPAWSGFLTHSTSGSDYQLPQAFRTSNKIFLTFQGKDATNSQIIMTSWTIGGAEPTSSAYKIIRSSTNVMVRPSIICSQDGNIINIAYADWTLNQFYIIRSTDGGNTFSNTPVFSAPYTIPFGTFEYERIDGTTNNSSLFYFSYGTRENGINKVKIIKSTNSGENWVQEMNFDGANASMGAYGNAYIVGYQKDGSSYFKWGGNLTGFGTLADQKILPTIDIGSAGNVIAVYTETAQNNLYAKYASIATPTFSSGEILSDLTYVKSLGDYLSLWPNNSPNNPDVVFVEPYAANDRNIYIVGSHIAPQTVAINCSPNPLGTGSTSGCGTFNSGQSVTVNATPTNCYTFTNWTENGNIVSSNASYTFTANSDRDLVANFTIIPYTISTLSNPLTGGSTSGGGTVNCATSVTVNATPTNCYTFTNWTENGNIVSSNASDTFTANSDRDLVANFTIKTYSINLIVNPNNGGSTSGGGQVQCGLQATIKANPNLIPPNPGHKWKFHYWTHWGTLFSVDSEYTFTPDSTMTLIANFEVVTGIENLIVSNVPNEYSLNQNYPNPFNPTTTIKFGIPKESFINLEIFNLIGLRVATLVNENRHANYYSEDFNVSNLSSGIYFYRLNVNNGEFVETKKLILLK